MEERKKKTTQKAMRQHKESNYKPKRAAAGRKRQARKTTHTRSRIARGVASVNEIVRVDGKVLMSWGMSWSTSGSRPTARMVRRADAAAKATP